MDRVNFVLKRVGLENVNKKMPSEISGGMKKRVAIARALVREPRLLLADEPTGNLDSGTSEEIMALLNRMHLARGLTMVIVTHNRKLAAGLDRVLEIEDGQLVHDILN